MSKSSLREHTMVPLANLVFNPGAKNQRNPLDESAQKMGLGFFEPEREGGISLWSLGMSEDSEDHDRLVELIETHCPDIKRLAETIANQGLINPICVYPFPKDQKEVPEAERTYAIESGHRRALAMLYLNARGEGITLFKKSPAIAALIDTRPRNTQDRLVRNVIENLARQDMSPIEKARFMRSLLDNGVERDELAEWLGISVLTVDRTLELLELPAEVQKQVDQKVIKPTRATRMVEQFGVDRVKEAASNGSEEIKELAAKSRRKSREEREEKLVRKVVAKNKVFAFEPEKEGIRILKGTNPDFRGDDEINAAIERFPGLVARALRWVRGEEINLEELHDASLTTLSEARIEMIEAELNRRGLTFKIKHQTA